MELFPWDLEQVSFNIWSITGGLENWRNLIPKDSLVIPFSTSLVLAAIHVIYASSNWLRRGNSESNASIVNSDEGDASLNATFFQAINDQAKNQSGQTIFIFELARLVGCTSLVGLSLTTLYHHVFTSEGEMPLSLFILQCPESYMAVTYLYCSILALASLSQNALQTSAAKRNNAAILLVAFCIYAYRNIWPLATYEEAPRDISEGGLLWAKIIVLFVTAVLVPLFVPNYYIPVDLENPMPIPNPEQTCSLFSFLTYSYLDPIIFAGYRVEHLTVDQLPPLCDTDRSKYLIKNAFPHIDPFNKAKPRHIFFGLMRILWKSYSLMALSVTGMAVIGFLSPIAIYHILNYMENGGVGDNIRPWFWILCLFIGPTLNEGFFQWYIWLATRALAHTEAILTELVFDHSLRIRFTTEDSEDKSSKATENLVVATPDSSSAVEDLAENDDSTSDLNTAASSASIDSRTTTATSTKSKGKAKAGTPTPTPAAAPKLTPAPKKETRKNANLVGKINNLVTSDLAMIVGARDFLYLVVNVPIQIILCSIFLYKLLGWSAFVGFGCIIILLPAPGYTTKLTQDIQKKKMKMTDARIQAVSEVVSVLRMIKLFGWEEKMSKQIRDTRDNELKTIWWLKVLQACAGAINSTIPTITMLVTYVTYTTIMKQELTPSIIFSSLTVFGKLRNQLFNVTWQLSTATRGKVSLDRIDDFLKNTEVIDEHAKAEPTDIILDSPPSFNKKAIGFKNASFSWSLGAADGSLTPSRRSYKLQVDNELLFQPDCMNLIVGPTGSGKTSILMALLGEMHFIRNGVDSWFNLPREGGVAYAAQESWVQNETIRSNILFGSPYDETRYHKVLDQCALDKDLELFEAGDNTEVGEKGITLSGGQKARLTLARAIYSPAQIILLDDIFAALDVHTSTKIVEDCFKGDLVKGRTILLATHNVALVLPVAKFVVSIGQDGAISNRTNDISALLADDPIFAEEIKIDSEQMKVSNQELESFSVKEKAPSTGKLVLEEEIVKGRVTWKSMKLYLSGLGGEHSIVFYGLWVAGFLLSNIIGAFQTWFLGYWGTQYEIHPPSEVSVAYYATIYGCIAFCLVIISNLSYIQYVSGSMNASRTIHAMLADSVLGTTLRWLDQTPTARIIARFTQDIEMVDGTIAQSFLGLTVITLSMLTSLGVILILTPLFITPALFTAALGFYLGSIYLRAQLSAMREKSNARSPLLAHFSAAISGIVSIRAYGAQSTFKTESLTRIDKYTHISRVSMNLNRWIGVRIDLLGQVFSVGLAAYLVYGKSIGASNTGFSLRMTSDFCSMVLNLVRLFNDFEVQSNSLERIQGYLDITHESKPTETGKPPAAWPTSGDLVVENLSARYSHGGPIVLHDISFHVTTGQRIGVVGRTGSGKSSLTLALLRCIITEGSVFYDGIDTEKINLDALRSNITIIPQTPELISGTLRRNLDPFDQYDDATLNDALQSAGLFSLQDDLGEARLALDSNITTSGGNLSVGERQILALARAMVRPSKLLILDEATSAIDYKTDSVIQETLRHKLDSDVTVITVAHRLQTIMDADKIMVLSEGRLAEFDTPQNLLSVGDSMFKALVDGSGDKDALYKMVTARSHC